MRLVLDTEENREKHFKKILKYCNAFRELGLP